MNPAQAGFLRICRVIISFVPRKVKEFLCFQALSDYSVLFFLDKRSAGAYNSMDSQLLLKYYIF